MTDQEHDVEDLIAALRDDLPSRDDERRMRARLATAGVVVGSVATLAEIGGAAASTSAVTGSAVAGGNVAATSGAGAAAAAGGTALGTSGSLSLAAGSTAAQGTGLGLVFAKVAALSGGTKAALVTALAVGAGYPAVTTVLPAAHPGAISAPATSPAARTPEPAARGRQQTPAGAAALVAGAEDAQVEPRPLPAPNQAPAATTDPGRSTRPVAKAAPGARVAAPAAPPVAEHNPADRASTLEAETVLIERALRAARAGDRDRALVWLSQHQQRYPNGALAPERQRALEQLQH